MGMFDSFLAKLKCSTCGKTALRKIQTKAFANILVEYRVGDVVEEAPIGEFWLKEEWWCEKCREKGKSEDKYEHPIYIRLVDGLFIGVYKEKDYKKERKKALDTYEIMRIFQKTARKGTERGQLLRRVYYLIEAAREDWKRDKKKKDKFPSFLPENKDELLDEILEMIKQEEGSELLEEN